MAVILPSKIAILIILMIFLAGLNRIGWLVPVMELSMDGTNLNVLDNTITVVDHGIGSDASNSLVSGNLIANFRGDGIRGLGDDMIYEYNTIKNSYDVDDNHDDGFQSWSYGSGGVGTGVV